jgi:hypothetical protein
MGMTLVQIHHDDLSGLAGGGRSLFARALARFGAACRLMHRGIVAAKMRRLHSEPAFHTAYAGEESSEPPAGGDAAKYPQRPLILSDKWDF